MNNIEVIYSPHLSARDENGQARYIVTDTNGVVVETNANRGFTSKQEALDYLVAKEKGEDASPPPKEPEPVEEPEVKEPKVDPVTEIFPAAEPEAEPVTEIFPAEEPTLNSDEEEAVWDTTTTPRPEFLGILDKLVA